VSDATRYRIEEWPIHRVKPYEHNPRRNDQAVEAVAESIKEFGFKQFIVVDSDGVIIAGHTRLKAAESLGMETVPVIVADDLTEEQVRAYRLADNRTAELAEWDFGLLDDELDLIDDIDMTRFGFDLGDEDDDGEPLTVLQGDPDAVPDADAVSESKARRGQIWRLGDHRLMCGDSTSREDVGRLMDGERADMVVTDPPYGMRLDTDYTSMKSKMGGPDGNLYDRVIGDNDDFDPSLIQTVFDNFGDVSELFLWGADYYSELIPKRNEGNLLVWDKTGGSETNLAYDKMYGSNFELCWSKARHKRAIIRVLWKGFFGLSSQDTRSRVHPTQKPVEVTEYLLDHFGEPGEVVVDLYGGSGSTMIACERRGRRCYMMELEPRYCDVIIARWEALTGREAELVEG